MSDIQDKFQKGLSSFQHGLKKGKDKVVTSQKIMSLKFKISELEKEKENLFTSLGITTYRKMSGEEVQYEDLEKLAENIKEIDCEIDDLQKQIEEKSQSIKSTCECGAEISSQDKFCKNCGKPIN